MCKSSLLYIAFIFSTPPLLVFQDFRNQEWLTLQCRNGTTRKSILNVSDGLVIWACHLLINPEALNSLKPKAVYFGFGYFGWRLGHLFTFKVSSQVFSLLSQALGFNLKNIEHCLVILILIMGTICLLQKL